MTPERIKFIRGDIADGLSPRLQNHEITDLLDAVSRPQQENARDYLRLLKSPENGRWYALDASGQTITHGHRWAWQCVHAVMRVPYVPRKFT